LNGAGLGLGLNVVKEFFHPIQQPGPYQCRMGQTPFFMTLTTLTTLTTIADEPGDDALIAAYAAGDVAAFERLYERHQAALYRFVRRLMGPANAAQVDEVFQDTWLRVVQSGARWQPQGAVFRTWLFTVAHHRAIDVLRRSGREVAIDAVAGEAEGGAAPWEPEATAWQHWPAPASATLGSDDLAFWRRAGERLLHCLDQLPLPQRSAFLLHHDDGLALADVAQVLEVGFETAKTRLRYAMSKLRTCMGAYLAPELR
jgi:RNA polymerase sigma factor (sigma-70 family)